jgi:hypothetical protein
MSGSLLALTTMDADTKRESAAWFIVVHDLHARDLALMSSSDRQRVPC